MEYYCSKKGKHIAHSLLRRAIYRTQSLHFKKEKLQITTRFGGTVDRALAMLSDIVLTVVRIQLSEFFFFIKVSHKLLYDCPLICKDNIFFLNDSCLLLILFTLPDIYSFFF